MKYSLAVAAILAASFPCFGQNDDALNDKIEQALKAAVAKVAPSVVQIITQGGIDQVVTNSSGQIFRKALGPTTGVVVSADGYIVSSSFNFINEPTGILVAVPGQPDPLVAKKVAFDKSRMLALLKIDAKGLTVPEMTPKKDILVGNWAIALGRTFDVRRDSPPSMSLGIISALGRIWSRAFQTDANVSPINYGGPIIDIQGRVQGIIVPASPRGEDETVGFEWYDSGIGFAIPMEDIQAVLPLLKKGKDLRKGLLGVRMKSQDQFSTAPEIGQVNKDSAADKAGLKPGDVIVEIDGQPVVRMAQIMHALGPKYDGDKIALKYKRGDKVVEVKDVQLLGTDTMHTEPFLGVLPMRDDPKLGVQIRHVFENSPAARAGLLPGDRIVKFGVDKALQAFNGAKSGRDQLMEGLGKLTPGTDLQLEVTRKKDGKNETVKVTLEAFPGTKPGDNTPIPDKLAEEASLKKALAPRETAGKKDAKDAKDAPKEAPKAEPKEKAETGLINRATAAGHNYWIFVHEDYDPNIAHALVVWFHPPEKHRKEDTEAFTKLWSDYCAENHIIMVGPTTDNQSGFVPSDTEFVLEAIRDVQGKYTVDSQRIVAHGLGVGGQMALYVGLHARELVRGVATVGAFASNLKDNVANQRLSFYITAGDRDPIVKNIAESAGKLAEKRFPVFYREIPNRGREYFEVPVLEEFIRWIDCLDRL